MIDRFIGFVLFILIIITLATVSVTMITKSRVACNNMAKQVLNRR